MKYKFLLISIIFLVQISFVFGGDDLANQINQGDPEKQNTREELLSDRHYKFYDYTHISSDFNYVENGFYYASYEIQIDNVTEIKFRFFIDTEFTGNGDVNFDYNFYSSHNSDYLDSTITFITDTNEYKIIDNDPFIYKGATKNGALTFHFDLSELTDENFINIANAKSLKIMVDKTVLALSAGQIERVKQFFRIFFVNKFSIDDLKYLEKDINVEYVAPEPELEPEAEPEPEPSFFNAIKDNNVEKVQEAINSEIDINEKNEEGLTPLMFAATKSSEPDIISLLINNGASIDEKDEDGWTPLMLASAFNENPEVVQRFIEEGADPNKQGEDGGDTALHKSIIFNRNVEIIKLLIDEGADINNADNLGYTPLMEVTMRSLFCNDEEEVINLLLNAGADINAKTKTGQTALTRTHNPKIKEVLIKAGAEGPTHIAWKRKFYVDSFGDPTEEPYITNIGKIEGTFSNTATNNSLLEAYFIIDNSNKIAFKLFEYGRDNPVKSYGNKGYKLLVKDASDTVHELYGNNYSDRITLNESSSNTLHNLLIDNDKLKIHIVESDNRTTTYDFELDARGYDYIYNEFLE